MNLKNEILNELSKDDYKDDFLKIRYIYLQICNTFSYDVRFIYATQDLKNEIYNKKINLEHVEEYEFACYTFARALVDALALYNFDAKIIKEHKGNFPHAYVIVRYKNQILKLDPTTRHDNTRVKMQSNTLDFISLNDEDITFIDKLKEADCIIKKSLKNNIDLTIYYNDETITKLVKMIENSAIQRGINDIDLFFEKLEYIILLINTRTDLKKYDDIDYYYSYLIKKFKINKKQKNYIKPAIFFKNGDKYLKDIINITLVEYEGFPPLFYILAKEKENYKIKKMDREEIIELLKNYNSPSVQFYFEQKILKMPEGKIFR